MQTYEACVKDMRIDRVWRELDASNRYLYARLKSNDRTQRFFRPH